MILKDLGYAVDTVSNGIQCVEIGHGLNAYSAIIMDVCMPQMNGFAASRIIRSLGFFTRPIYGVSGNAREAAEEEGILAGMTAYIEKPLSKEKIRDALETQTSQQVGTRETPNSEGSKA